MNCENDIVVENFDFNDLLLEIESFPCSSDTERC